MEKSWFSTTLYTAQNQKWSPIFSLLSMFSPVESTDLESTSKKSKKIRIYLNCEQRKLLRQWIGVARFTYNRTVEYLQQPETKANWRAIKGDILRNLPEWAKPVPYQIKSIAVRDACIAVREAKAKYSKTGQFQQVKFKSRKNPVQSCYVPKSAVSAKGVYYTKLGQIKFSEPLPEGFGDCRLVAVRGQYYLCLPVDAPKHKSENKHRVVALDPGVRNFLTLFSENSFGWIGSNDMGRVQRLCHHLDDLISRLTKAKSKTKQRMKKAANRLRSKIRNLIDELHHKTALFLVQNFDVILLPTFEVSQMTIKSSRKLRSKSVRQMLNWAHYRFELFLKHKAVEYNKFVVDVSEAYTSKTVSWTGEILNNLGGKKVVTGNDGFRLDRDLNGARGILIKSVVEKFSTTLGDTPSVS
ncbi:RNA-guided endonuclease InsQ/TnpB family protein [Dapis sp. BLCC M229]|uniref:RNA-guided endonuclease InsQ/TnpB family protein n=1 Tax=Dapis sp. BLCC M229 TaxID=3400188 RepID=UPI003CEF58BE